MSQFTYTAKSADGRIKSGTTDAKDQAELAHALRAEGFVLTSVLADGAARDARGGDVFARMRAWRGVSLVDRMMFTRNLAVMIGAGLALNRALTTLGEQTVNKKLKDIIAQVTQGVQEGKPFSDCIAKHPAVFSELYVNMVKVGETAGNLEEVFNSLAEQMKKDHDIVSRVRGALIYPGVIFTIMIIIGYLMMVLVVPKLAAVFADVGADLPASTQFLIMLSTVMINYWYAVLAGVAGAAFGARAALRTTKGKELFDALVLKVPVIKGLSTKLNSARFARTLATLIDSGVPIVKALEILASTLSNHFFAESLRAASVEIQKGKTLFDSLKKYERLYPPLVTQMVSVGEETGSLTKILAKLADFYEEEVNNTTKNLSTIIEPVMMVMIGAGVGFFALSMITPMYSVLNNI